MIIKALDETVKDLLQVRKELEQNKMVSEDIKNTLQKCVFQIMDVHNELCRMEMRKT